MNPFTIDEIIYVILKSDSHKTLVLLSHLNTQFNKIYKHLFDSYDINLNDIGKNIFSTYTATISKPIKPHKKVTIYGNNIVIIDHDDDLKGVLDEIGPVDNIKTLTMIIQFELYLIIEKHDKIPIKSQGFLECKDIKIDNCKFQLFKNGNCRVLIQHKNKNTFMKCYKQLIDYLKSK